MLRCVTYNQCNRKSFEHIDTPDRPTAFEFPTLARHAIRLIVANAEIGHELLNFFGHHVTLRNIEVLKIGNRRFLAAGDR